MRERRVTPRRIIAAIDASDEGLAALDLLARLPLPADAEFTLLHLDPEGLPLTRHRAGAALQGRSLAHERASGVPTAQQVLSRAAALGADLLVLGSEGLAAHPGALELSIADEVLARAHCAVLLARLPPPGSASAKSHALSRQQRTVISSDGSDGPTLRAAPARPGVEWRDTT